MRAGLQAQPGGVVPFSEGVRPYRRSCRRSGRLKIDHTDKDDAGEDHAPQAPPAPTERRERAKQLSPNTGVITSCGARWGGSRHAAARAGRRRNVS